MLLWLRAPRPGREPVAIPRNIRCGCRCRCRRGRSWCRCPGRRRSLRRRCRRRRGRWRASRRGRYWRRRSCRRGRRRYRSGRSRWGSRRRYRRRCSRRRGRWRHRRSCRLAVGGRASPLAVPASPLRHGRRSRSGDTTTAATRHWSRQLVRIAVTPRLVDHALGAAKWEWILTEGGEDWLHKRRYQTVLVADSYLDCVARSAGTRCRRITEVRIVKLPILYGNIHDARVLTAAWEPCSRLLGGLDNALRTIGNDAITAHLTRDCIASAFAGGVLDCDPGLEQPRHVEDAENEHEEDGCHQCELDQDLAAFASALWRLAAELEYSHVYSISRWASCAAI